MKYMICVLLTLLSFSLFAVIRTVDNNNPSAGQYTTIQAAVTAASNDDIIYVYPSNIAYAGFSVSKRLKIYGAGWAPNTNGSSNIRTTLLSSNAVFNAGSEYSLISGFNSPRVNMQGVVGNVTVEDCCLTDFYIEGNQPVSINSSGYILKGCRFAGAGNYGAWIINQNQQTGITLVNCLFVGSANLMGTASSNVTVLNCSINTTSALFTQHNSNPNFRNNYITTAGYTGTSTFPSDAVIAYNMSSTALFPTGTTNQNNIPLSSVFDSLFHPLPGSPAIDAGDPASDYNDLDGSRNDIGVFGGPYPYDDNGYTTLPTITDISGTLYTSPSQGLQIHVEASSRH